MGAYPALETFRFSFFVTEAWNPVTDRFGAVAPIGGLAFIAGWNARIIGAAQRQLGVPDGKMLSSVALYANSSAATIPLTLSLAAERRPFQAGARVLMSAAGAGLTGGALVLEV
ncbi:MAG: hypothetical protein J0H08_14300 [Rhizobiales bacterium]|nr:hypothetical protein [Hyphomicrobiales bacterium]